MEADGTGEQMRPLLTRVTGRMLAAGSSARARDAADEAAVSVGPDSVFCGVLRQRPGVVRRGEQCHLLICQRDPYFRSVMRITYGLNFWSSFNCLLKASQSLRKAKWGPDEEAVVDLGKTSSTVNTKFEKEELESHRAVYIGVHVPFSKESRRRHRHRGHKHHHRRRKDKDSDREDGRESPSYDTPSQRVQFILGTEDDDEDHIPHDLFTEMDELCYRDGEEYEWKETARWLKFEEDVEDGGDRWSKPYVATLSLHSLFELRSCILNGTVMLDMRASTLDEIADMVLDNMIASGQLDESIRENVREALLKRHHHQNEKRFTSRIPLVRSFADIGKKHSDPHLLERNGILASPQSAPGNLDSSKSGEIKGNGSGGSRENSTVDFSKVDMNFMRKIPSGAEASNVLVGEVDFLERPIIAFVRLAPAVLLSGLTEVPVPTRFLFLLLGPAGKAPQYHEIGRSIATLMTDEIFHDVAYKAKDRNDLLSGIDEFLDQVTVLPPGEWDPSIRIEPPKSVPSQEKRKIPVFSNGSAPSSGDAPKEAAHHEGPELQRTGRLFGGLILDIKRKAPFFLSDFKDALSLQCLASILFLYCACMSPVITFGGLLGEATEGRISAIESLFGASLTGIAYSLFAGQPLTILGSTGPVLVFEKILFKFCRDYHLSYLSLRTSIGLWTSFLCIVLVATDASSLVCYITRFTEEAFAALICIIFIYEALEKLFHLGETYAFNMHNNLEQLTSYSCVCVEPSNPGNETLKMWEEKNVTARDIPWGNLTVSECRAYRGAFVGSACGLHGPYIPDVLFWSVILFFTTFFLSSFLKQFKTKRYFPTKVRSTISDFAVFLTIVVMVVIDYLVGVPSPKLHVPEKFEPTDKNRGWIISPLGENPWWTLLIAAIPALLCTILIFMDQQITAVIINRKEHKLKKGAGYHLDLLVVGVMLGVCSVMGLPWFVAATVLSISHVNSLKVESECSAPGEQPKFLGIREQRVTGLMIFILMGLSVFMTSVLKFIPMPVLYGVFLYMGVSSLKGIQLFDRIKLLGMPAKHQPGLIYLRHVPLWKVHAFTAVQLTCLVLLWAIKASAAAVVFPMMVLALVFVRKLMDLCFTKRELSWLDDLMPESKKKKEDDKKKKEKEEAERMLQAGEDTVHLPFEGGSLLQIPVKALKYSVDPSVVNISDEMAKTAQWKALSMNTENAKVTRPNPRQRSSSYTWGFPVTFTGDLSVHSFIPQSLIERFHFVINQQRCAGCCGDYSDLKRLLCLLNVQSSKQQLPAINFDSAQNSMMKSEPAIRAGGHRARGRWHESTEAVELENFSSENQLFEYVTFLKKLSVLVAHSFMGIFLFSCDHPDRAVWTMLEILHSLGGIENLAQYMEIVAHGYLGYGEAQHSVDKLVNMTYIFQKLAAVRDQREWVTTSGAHKTLVNLLSARDTNVLLGALLALASLAESPECREKISELNIVENLLMILHEYDLLSKRLTAELLRLLCAERQVREQVKLYEGVPVLLSLLHSDHLKLLWSVVWILVQICEDPETSVEIRIWGGIKQLLHILRGDRNFVSDRSSIGSLSSANAAGRIQQLHLSEDLSPREIQENTFSLQAACCAALTELVLDDSNAHQVVQGGKLDVPGSQGCVVSMTEKPPPQEADSGYPQVWSVRHRGDRLFPTDLFETFIDIGHYVRDISAYEELVSKLNLLVEDELKQVAENVESINQNKAPSKYIGNYAILDHLGSGAFGCVYKVRKRSGQNLLAMKEVNLHNPAFGKDKKDRDSSVRNIVSELTIIKEQLYHPNVVRYYKTFLENDRLYIVMELIEGAPLGEHFSSLKEKRHRFAEERLWKIFIQLCLALRYLHKEKRIIHRDLTPNNIMLGDKDRVTVKHFFINKGFYDYHMNTLLYCFNIVCDMGDQ
ncbi:hypothetical protein JEQ12_008142 [Ovis aries]|uniref:Anion exchange protein n=1 Tax=Ovis aries TaxID=9940 RepID=A0A835ZP08_SHEEP|nr:hypothetical protein JEQ12_008142 [Ovis aries]